LESIVTGIVCRYVVSDFLQIKNVDPQGS